MKPLDKPYPFSLSPLSLFSTWVDMKKYESCGSCDPETQKKDLILEFVEMLRDIHGRLAIIASTLGRNIMDDILISI